MNELQKIVDILKKKPASLSELAVSSKIDEEKCREHVAALKGLGVVYETGSRRRRKIHLRLLPPGPKIGVISYFKAIDDIEILDERPPKPSQIIDLVQGV